jgi:hypothetical protein
MTTGQKKVTDNFKKAIEYRKKTGVSLKEAFAYVYGKKVGVTSKKTKLGDVFVTYPSENEAEYVMERGYHGEFKGHKRIAGANKKYTKKQLEKIASDYAYVTEADFDKVTYRLLDKDYTQKLLPVYLKAIQDWKKKYNVKVLGVIKKVVAKKVTPKKKTIPKKVTSSHKDTKSHNVNIRVVSGFVGRLIIKTFTLSELKKMNPIYFEKGKDKSAGIYKRKLIISKKLESQVMIEAKKDPILKIKSYSVRLINPEGSISTPKKFDSIFDAANYIGKNIII